jgi:hypothetical protein
LVQEPNVDSFFDKNNPFNPKMRMRNSTIYAKSRKMIGSPKQMENSKKI